MKEMLLINSQFVKLSLPKKRKFGPTYSNRKPESTYFISSPGEYVYPKDALPESKKNLNVKFSSNLDNEKLRNYNCKTNFDRKMNLHKQYISLLFLNDAR